MSSSSGVPSPTLRTSTGPRDPVERPDVVHAKRLRDPLARVAGPIEDLAYAARRIVGE